MADRVQQTAELLVVDQGVDPFPLGHVGELGLGEAGVHQQQPGAELAGGKHGFDQSAVIAAQHRDHRSLVQPVPGPRPRQRVGTTVQLVEGQLAPVVHQADGAGVTECGHSRRARDGADLFHQAK